MARDKNTRPCRDCGEQKAAYEWCETCAAYTCDDCNDGHDCIGDALIESTSVEQDADCPPSHADDCDDPLCEGACLDSEDLDDSDT